MSPRVERAFVAACRAELDALKPGNVHRFAGGHRMTAADFEASAVAAAPAIARPRATVGERILAAVEATRAAVGQNTNLGIVLLAAPLAAAAERGPLEPSTVRAITTGLTVADAEQAFAAIRLASPGGLGGAARHDVRSPATVTLLEAMAAAADRDRIAWNYAHGFDDVLGFGLERLSALATRGLAVDWQTTGLYLGLLARTADTHVARKHGAPIAAEVRHRASAFEHRFLASERPDDLLPELLRWDTQLKAAQINPGTSADLTVATLFARYLVAEVRQA